MIKVKDQFLQRRDVTTGPEVPVQGLVLFKMSIKNLEKLQVKKFTDDTKLLRVVRTKQLTMKNYRQTLWD